MSNKLISSKKKLKGRESKYKISSKGYFIKKQSIGKSDQSSYNIHTDFYHKLIKNKVFLKNEKISARPNYKKYDKLVYELNPKYKLKLKTNLKKFLGFDLLPTDTMLFEVGKNIKKIKPQFRHKTYDYLDDSGSNWFKKLYEKNVIGNTMIYEANLINKTFSVDIEEQEYRLKTDDVIEEEIKSEYIKEHKLREEPLQKILFGAPGTGKSYKISNDLEKIYAKNSKEYNDFIYRITVHPEFTYHDFIGNIMPTVTKKEKDSVIEYTFKSGVFTKAYIKAKKNPKYDIYLILEEMSRGNIVSIFGDLFQLLDRDEITGKSEYGIKNDLILKKLKEADDSYKNESQIILPSNFHILGTINTSDQSVFSIDNAFKRRFEFEYIDTKPIDIDGDYINNFEFELEGIEINWIDLYTKINSFIIKQLDMEEDKQIGQFFIKFKKDKKFFESNFNKITQKLLHYLWYDIHKSNFSEKSIFKNDIKTYSMAYNKLKNKKNIFNKILFSGN